MRRSGVRLLSPAPLGRTCAEFPWKQKERRYEEKKAAYVGLFTSLHNAAVSPSDKNSKAYALWQTKCHIFGSDEVPRISQEIVDTNNGPSEAHNKAFQELLDAIRRDLNNS